MVPLAALWLPILLSAVVAFLVSSLIHMVLPWHKGDYRGVPEEERLRQALRPLAIPPGDYMVPRPNSMQEMRSPEFTKKINDGPNLVLTVLPSGTSSMGRSLGMWFVYILVVAVFAAYVAGRALTPASDRMEVFRFAATTAFLGFAGALWQMSIWYRRSWGTTFRATVDGLIYACITGGILAWLWPH